MGGRLGLAAADVTDPSGVKLGRATVHVIGELLQIRSTSRGGAAAPLAEYHGVDRVDRANVREWRITMADGQVWTVVRGKGCSSCGGR